MESSRITSRVGKYSIFSFLSLFKKTRWDYVELGGNFYPDMDRLVALERGMKTWANRVDANID